jgi:hypothetical protein
LRIVLHRKLLLDLAKLSLHTVLVLLRMRIEAAHAISLLSVLLGRAVIGGEESDDGSLSSIELAAKRGIDVT